MVPRTPRRAGDGLLCGTETGKEKETPWESSVHPHVTHTYLTTSQITCSREFSSVPFAPTEARFGHDRAVDGWRRRQYAASVAANVAPRPAIRPVAVRPEVGESAAELEVDIVALVPGAVSASKTETHRSSVAAASPLPQAPPAGARFYA